MATPSPRPDDVPRPVVGLRARFPDRHRLPAHRHRKAQLVHAASGVMTVSTAEGLWVVPPQRAVWVPGATEHAIAMSGEVAMETVYLEPAAVPQMPARCCVVNVSPLLRELVGRAVDVPDLYPADGAVARLMQVLIDELEASPTQPLHLPAPSDPRLRRVAEALATDPADGRGLEAWGRVAGASPRTLDRLFRRETGMSFRRYREQLRLVCALEQLAAGETVTAVALSLGYDGPSAFIAMFRRNLGETPGRYFAATR